MSEPADQKPEQPVPDAGGGASAGTMLRQAREALGLHIGALAVSLKVPVKKLEALESDDLGQLPDAVFARALAATVCRSLKIDPAPVLARMPQLHVAPLQVVSQETPVRFDSHGDGLRGRSMGALPRPVLYVSALLIVAAIAVALLPSWRGAGGPAPEQAPDGVVIRTVPNQLEPSAMPAPAAADTSAMPRDATAAVATATPAASAAAPSGAALPLPTAASAAPAVAADAKPIAVSAAAGGAIAVFRARDASWVQVVDATGVVHLRKTMAVGETVGINGSLPLTVVIGRAQAIDVVVRGKPLDVQALARDNVARFQIQ